MTIVASGQLNLSTIGAEYGAPANDLYLGSLYRGHASKYVRNNSGNNGATNLSAGVPTTATNLTMAEFYGQAKGWTYTNSVQRINNYHCHGEFGDDWLGANGTDWPCYYVNNNSIVSTSTATYALVIYGRQNNGPFTFTNNHEIQGAGGAANSGAGQHAVYIYNSENAAYANRPIIVNNHAIRGGGGGGGKGGTGGTGGQGYYDTGYTAQEGPAYDGSTYTWNTSTGSGSKAVRWANTTVYSGMDTGTTAFGQGSITYYRHTLRDTSTSQQQGAPGSHEGPGPLYYHRKYEIYRQFPSSYRTVTGGGGGGAGGNGGQGIGYNDPNTGGAPGAGGGGGGVNAGAGGTGGTGGTGGSWGENGQTGNTGGGGGWGNYSGWGPGGAGGAGGGAAGYSVYAATKWGFANYNTINGPYGGGVANT